MSTWKPWHQIVQLRDDLKSGELSLAIFAADLYTVGIKNREIEQAVFATLTLAANHYLT